LKSIISLIYNNLHTLHKFYFQSQKLYNKSMKGILLVLNRTKIKFSFLVLYISCFFILLANPAFASKLLYKKYNVSQGLLQSQIKSIVQDEEGGMWFGTVSGLSYYNGKHFINFKDTLYPHSSVLDLFRDSDGYIWVATISEGLYVLKNGKVYRHYTKTDGLPSMRINRIVEKNGYIWLCTGNGIVVLKDSIIDIIDSSEGLPDTRVNSIVFDGEDNLWVGTVSGIFVLKNSSFVYPYNRFRNSLFVHHLLRGKDGKIYAATRYGIWIFNRGRITHIGPPQIPSTFITHIVEDPYGRIFFSTDRGLIKLYKNRIFHYKLENLYLNYIYVDREHNMWIGTRGGGVLKLQNEAFTHYTLEDGLPDLAVISIKALGDTTLLIGTNKGMAVKRGEKMQVFTLKDGLPDMRVTSFSILSRNRIFVGTWKGIVIYEKGRLYKNRLTHAVGNMRVNCMEIMGDTLFLGTPNGLHFINLTTKKRGTILKGRHNVTFITKDSKNNALLFIADGNVYSWKEAIIQKLNPVGYYKDLVYTTILTNDTAIYAGTESGFFTIKDNKVTKLDEKDGLSDCYVVALLDDKRGNIWIGTNKGINRFSGKDVRIYNSTNGFPGEELITPQSISMDSQGNLWFGTFTGLFSYNPELEFIDTVPPFTKITTVEINANPVQITKKFLKLPGSRSSVRIEFVGLSFKDETDVTYSYRLLGYNDEWSKPSKKNEITFINLKPGHYTFQVKSFNRERIPSRNIAAYSFFIPAPLWQRPYFQVLTFIAFILLLYALTQMRVKWAKRNEEKFKRMVKEKTRELEQKSYELEQLAITDPLTGLYNRRHLNDKIKMEIERSKRYRRKFSYLMIDVDGFKQINDTFGHTAGDDVLRIIAKIIRDHIREADFAARYGGDEFVILLPETSLKGALALAERIRSTVERTVFGLNEIEFSTTVSIGVFTYDKQEIETPEELLRIIDWALYRAKIMGKNRVEVVKHKFH